MASDREQDDEKDDGAAEVDYPELTEVVEWYDDWEEETRDARALSARDYDYYDNAQWTKDEADEQCLLTA